MGTTALSILAIYGGGAALAFAAVLLFRWKTHATVMLGPFDARRHQRDAVTVALVWPVFIPALLVGIALQFVRVVILKRT